MKLTDDEIEYIFQSPERTKRNITRDFKDIGVFIKYRDPCQ